MAWLSVRAAGHTYTVAGGDLKLIGEPASSSGSDSAGTFDALALSWAPTGTSTPQYVTTFKAYHGRSALVFQQTWPTGQPDATGGSTFPSLHQVTENALGTLEYTGYGYHAPILRVSVYVCMLIRVSVYVCMLS